MKESVSSLLSSRKRCRVNVVLTAPLIRDSLYATVKLESGAVKLPCTPNSSRLHPFSAVSKAEPVNVSKNKKKQKSKNCGKETTLRSSFHIGFGSNPPTVRERRRHISALQDYNLDHEDDYFDCVDPSSLPSKILLNSSLSSSGSSSPALSRRTSLASFLPKLTREVTPLQFREVLHWNKDESINSGNSFGHISFINRKLKKSRVARKNLCKPKSCVRLSISKNKKNSCVGQLETILKGLGTSDPNGDDELSSDVEPYFTDDENN